MLLKLCGEESVLLLFSFLKKFLLVAQSYLTFCDPMDCSSPSSSVCGILPARMLEWVASPFSRGSSWSRDGIQVSHIAGGFFTIWTMLFLQFPFHHRPGPLCCSVTNDHMREKNFKWASALLKQVTCLDVLSMFTFLPLFFFFFLSIVGGRISFFEWAKATLNKAQILFSVS